MRDDDNRAMLWAVVYELSAATTFVLAAALVTISPIVGSTDLCFVGLASLFGSIGVIKA